MSRKALFLDRDGVINIDKGYVSRIEDFHFVEGIFEVCQRFQSMGYLIFIVTNQSGIGRKYFTIQDYFKVTGSMMEKFKENEIKISRVYFSPSLPYQNCPRRKPRPGMILEAKEEFDLDLGNSILIGDRQSDIQAAQRAGIKYTHLIKSNSKIDLEYLMMLIHGAVS